MKDDGILEGLGLTAGERKCYLALLETGVTTAGPLVKRTGMQKSAVYFCLEKLLEKGLASYVIRNNVKQFEAARPARILDYLDEKEKELEAQRESVKRLLPGLEKIAPKEEKRVARVFEGWDGMKTAFDDILETMKPGDEYRVFNVSPQGRGERFLRFMEKFQARRRRKRIPMRIMVSEATRGDIGAMHEADRQAKVKYLPSEYVMPAAVNIYGDKILLTLWTETPNGFQ
ncbi:MAG: helix-turn-helix domain-containing protein, partial [Candidatus Micrarchaeia archaeon]